MRLERIRDRRTSPTLVAQQDLTVRRPTRQGVVEGRGPEDLGDRKAFALLSRFDCIRPKPIIIDAPDRRVAREDRPQSGDAEFGCLLRHEIDAGALQGGEHEPEVRLSRLLPRLGLDRTRCPAFPEGFETGAPLAVPPVEKKKGRPFFEAHDTTKIVGLLGIEPKRSTWRQCILDEKPDLGALLWHCFLSVSCQPMVVGRLQFGL